jgi:hypothetical protein
MCACCARAIESDDEDAFVFVVARPSGRQPETPAKKKKERK